MGWCSNTLGLVRATALAGQCLLYQPHSSRLSLAPVLPEICSVLCSQDGPHVIPNQDAFTDWPWCFFIRSLMFQQHMAESILSLFWGWKFTVLVYNTSARKLVMRRQSRRASVEQGCHKSYSPASPALHSGAHMRWSSVEPPFLSTTWEQAPGALHAERDGWILPGLVALRMLRK